MGQVLVPPKRPTGQEAQQKQARAVLASPFNDCQLVAWGACIMPTTMTPAEAVDRSIAILATAMVRGHELNRKLEEAAADYNREVATRVVDTTPKLVVAG